MRPNSTIYGPGQQISAPKDPWLNKDPWPGPPVIMPPGVPMINPSIVAPRNSGIIANVGIPPPSPGMQPVNSGMSPGIPSVGLTQPTDPWMNKNPWSGPSVPPPQNNFGSNIRPTTPTLYPSKPNNILNAPMSPARTSTYQPAMDPWQNRDPWGPKSNQVNNQINNMTPTNPIIGNPMNGPSPSNLWVTPPPNFINQPNFTQTTSNIRQSPIDPWTNRDPWSNPPTVSSQGFRGGGGP